MSWTDERVALLRKMWVEGRTAAEIAKELGGITRNAVIGKAHRLKLSNRVSPIQQNTKKPVVRVQQQQQDDAKPAPVRAPVAPAVSRVPRKSGGVKMIDLKEKMCRWPMGDPKDADFLFCGCESFAGLVYCEEHARAAYQVARSNRTIKAEDIDRLDNGVVSAEDKEASAA